MSSFISVDDSGVRHQGRNGDVTPMGNDFFAGFSSTESKSRINFLQLLQAGTPVYRLNDEALVDWREQGLPQALCQNLMAHPPMGRVTTAAWEQQLDDWVWSLNVIAASPPKGPGWVGGSLLVLLRPDVPLHTHGSENDIRGFVKWRKISGGTRSDLGRSRDFADPWALGGRHALESQWNFTVEFSIPRAKT